MLVEAAYEILGKGKILDHRCHVHDLVRTHFNFQLLKEELFKFQRKGIAVFVQ